MKIKWTCKNCETPNVLTTLIGEQYALSCLKCGAPGKIETDTIDYEPNVHLSTNSTCFEPVLSSIQSAEVIGLASKPRNWRV